MPVHRGFSRGREKKCTTEKTLEQCKNKNSLGWQVFIRRKDVGTGLMRGWGFCEQGHLGLKSQRVSLQSSLPVLVQPSDRDRSVQGEAEQFKGR